MGATLTITSCFTHEHWRVLNSLFDLATTIGQPWHVGNQLPLGAWKPNGDPWTPSPDIMVHPQAGGAKRDGMSARDDGLPALIVEVASPSTWRYDVDAAAGKAMGYLALGVPEILALQRLDVLVAELDRRRGDVLLQVRDRGGSGDRQHHRRALQ